MELEEIYERYLEDRATEAEIRYLLRCFNDAGLAEEVAAMVDRHLAAGTRRRADKETELEAAVREIYAALKPQLRSGWSPVFRRFWPLAAAVLISAVAMVCWLRPVIKQQQLVARAGERKMIELSDGTKIWLSPSGALRYPDQFNGNTREVQLEGEAYFEVAKDKNHPFLVHSPGLTTRVVGTAFTISPGAVSVVTGIVRVATLRQAVLLRPGQRVLLTAGRLLAENFSGRELLLKRRNGVLAYRGTPAGEVVADLQRYYNVPLVFDGDKALLCYGEFDTNRPLAVVLEQLSAVTGGRVRRQP